MSFCYKVSPQACEVIISLLRAKGTFSKFQAMGLNITPLAMEMLASTSSLTSLDLCGVSALNDQMVEMVGHQVTFDLLVLEFILLMIL